MRYAIAVVFVFQFFYGFTASPNKNIVDQALSNPDSVLIWDKLSIQCDPGVVELLKKQVEQGKKSETVSGFRLQIYFGSGTTAHTQGSKIKSDFQNSNPAIKAYLLFKSPDFLVRVGDFRTKSEALKLQKSIINQFPNAFIVADEIALPNLVTNPSIN